mgnify:CR=1 FL=1
MFDTILGHWPTHKKFIMTGCDEKYFNKYFPRFYKTFTTLWELPIHVHVTDPSKQSLDRLEKLNVSYTYCYTNKFDWKTLVNKFRIEHPGLYAVQPEALLKNYVYESYCQSKRFIVASIMQTKDQSIIIADVDAYAKNKPSSKMRKNLFKNTAFTVHNGRLMATFCHFHPRDLDKIRRYGTKLLNIVTKQSWKIGIDQKMLNEIHKENAVALNGTWMRHKNVKGAEDKKLHDECIIYHEKGTRGKLKPVEMSWTDIE